MPVLKVKEGDGGDVEFYYDDRFVASWGKPKQPEAGELRLPVYMVVQLAEMLVAIGKEARSEEILKLLGGKGRHER